MDKLELLYEGKAKKLYRTSTPGLLWLEYKDDATAFNAQKRGSIQGKGVVNNRASAMIFERLEREGIPTHFHELLSDREMLVKDVRIIPVEVVVRNIATGSLTARFAIPDGTPLRPTVLEFCYKSDALGDPPMNRDIILAMGLATPEQIDALADYAHRINAMLQALFDQIGLTLVDFKLEFGLLDGKVVLADEISPDTCRLWDKATHERMDKDRFRRSLGGEAEAYQEVLKRLEGLLRK